MKKLYILLVAFLIQPFQKSIAQSTETDTLIIGAFKQGGPGSGAANCASISVIKLAITEYGIEKVFQKVDTADDKYVVQLRNGKTIELTKDEEKAMKEVNKFENPKDERIYTMAMFCYAVMTKNKWMRYPGDYNSITEAAIKKRFWRKDIYLLAENTEDNLLYLGLDKSYKKIKSSEINNYPKAIITNPYHSAYSSNGFYDEYGAPLKILDFPAQHKHTALNPDMNYVLIK